MKTTFLFAPLMAALPLLVACQGGKQQAEEPATPKVYMTTDISPEGLVKVYEALGKKAHGRVAVKISTGEPGRKQGASAISAEEMAKALEAVGRKADEKKPEVKHAPDHKRNFLKPELIKDLVQKVNGTIVECNVAYGGRRNTTEAHLEAAREHGFFDIAHVDIMDAEGDTAIAVRDTTHIKYNLVGNHLKNYDFMINLAHFKGHEMGGFGGVLKNQSIGVASSAGKAYIHSAGVTTDTREMWNHIGDQIGFLESMAAAAQSVHDYFGEGENILYINVMNNMSIDCDCNAYPAAPLLKDIGILASTDPVALDQACIDLVTAVKPEEGNDNAPLLERIKKRHGTHIIDYAEKIGLGSKEYQLVNIDQ
ncbi:MAG: DUF362 domain-containing protein [Bacteroidaceae bacterium]|nr:DUF362 domain-containing protein [Bacteroidaceae bacterium]